MKRLYIDNDSNIIRAVNADLPTPCPLDAGEVCLRMQGSGPIQFPERWPDDFVVPDFAKYDEAAPDRVRAMTEEEQAAFVETHTTTVTRDSSLVTLELRHNALLAQLGLPPLAPAADIEASLLALEGTDPVTALKLTAYLENTQGLLFAWRENHGGVPSDAYTDQHWAQASYAVVPVRSW